MPFCLPLLSSQPLLLSLPCDRFTTSHSHDALSPSLSPTPSLFRVCRFIVFFGAGLVLSFSSTYMFLVKFRCLYLLCTLLFWLRCECLMLPYPLWSWGGAQLSRSCLINNTRSHRQKTTSSDLRIAVPPPPRNAQMSGILFASASACACACACACAYACAFAFAFACLTPFYLF